MKKAFLTFGLLFCYYLGVALNFTIIESQSFNTGHAMDTKWSTILSGMGHTSSIAPQTTLDNNAFFATTDILIISSGVINLPANRVVTILQFLQTGKSVYLQSEYLSSYSTNQAFASIVSSLGGSFTWTAAFSGDLNPMNILGTYATTNNIVASLPYFWYSYSGTGDCNTVNILQYGGGYHGFQYIPANPSYGSIISTTDQDWINTYSAPSELLMENLITHLINPPVSVAGVQVDIGNDTTICNGNNLLLDATTTNGTYLWQDGTTNATFNVTTSGTYYVRVTVNSCSGIDTIHVNYYSSQIIDLGNDTTLCQGNSLILDATTTNGTYLWQDGATNPTFNVSQQGTYWVQVSVNGCSGMDSITIMYSPLPFVDLGNDTTLCMGSTLLLDATATNASYLWQNGTTNSTFNISQQGLYWVELTINGCSIRDSIIVNYVTSPVFDLGNDTTLCPGSSLLLDATTTNGTYLWQNATTNPTFNVSQQGTYWVQVSVNGCSGIDSITVIYSPLPSVDLGNDTTLCMGSTLLLDATATNASYLWQNGATNSTFIVSQQGFYWVDVTVNGCNSSDSININYSPLPVFSLGNDTSLCEGGTLLLDATTTNATYMWQNGNNNPVLNVIQQGIYWVDLTVNGCSSRDSISVNYNPSPVIDIGTDTTLCRGNSLFLDASNINATYLWQDGSTNSTLFVSEAGVYSVIVTINGCSRSGEITITLSDCNMNLFIPNSFTPNSDGQNDIFFVTGEGIREITLDVFDRWGECIFESKDIDYGWDGTYRGKKCESSVYVYYIEVMFESGIIEMRKGTISLIR